MFHANFWCYVWDVEDEGIDNVLDRLHGEVGVTGVSVATSYHGVKHLRIHAGVSPRVYRSDAGIYFQPEADRYVATRIRPIVAGWLKSRNPLARIADACARRSLHLRSWTVGCRNAALAERHPDAAVRNVFGDLDPTWLCPANPDVREYLCALVGDLSHNYSLEAIELESFLFPPSGHVVHDSKVGLVFGEVDRLLLRLCFCPSCRQIAGQAGVDVAGAARSAQVRLEEAFAAGRSTALSLERLLDTDRPIRDFWHWRIDAVTSLIAAIANRSRIPLVFCDAGDSISSAGVRQCITPHVRALLGRCGSPDADAVDRLVDRLGETQGEPPGVELGFYAYPPACPDAPTLVRQLTRAAELGVRSVNIDNYGVMPEVNLDWARQAIRAATRISG